MVLAISFLETPLKLRGGITVPLGLGVGRLIFRVLNAAELTLAITLTPALLLSDATATSLGGAATRTLIAIWALSLTQVALLPPCLGRRARRGSRSTSALGGSHAADCVRGFQLSLLLPGQPTG